MPLQTVGGDGGSVDPYPGTHNQFGLQVALSEQRTKMPRIAPLQDGELDEAATALLAPMAKSGRVLNIFRTMAQHTDLARRWMVFANHILG